MHRVTEYDLVQATSEIVHQNVFMYGMIVRHNM
jgi:hypothetical protein